MCRNMRSIFFFKQKTAYEMRISDWSSDVCSSDLFDVGGLGAVGLGAGDDARVDHRVEHDPGAAQRRLRVGGRRIARRRLDQPGDQRRLRQRHLGRAVAEKTPRGGVAAITAAVEIDLVQIEIEDRKSTRLN